jgi:hypothetical protein
MEALANSNQTISAVGIHVETIAHELQDRPELTTPEVKENWVSLIEHEELDLDNVKESMETLYSFIQT